MAEALAHQQGPMSRPQGQTAPRLATKRSVYDCCSDSDSEGHRPAKRQAKGAKAAAGFKLAEASG